MLNLDAQKRLDNGIKLIEDKAYSQAYHILKDLLKEKMLSNLEKGKIYYHIANVFKNIESGNSLINELMITEEDLISSNKNKNITPENARKFLGRKYLKMSAECDYVDGLAEYALICINCEPGGGLNYDPTEENANVAIAWAEQMKKHKNSYIRLVANIVYTKYYFIKCVTSSDDTDVNNFADTLLETKQMESTNEYVKYFLGHLYTNPKFKDYKDGQYSNIRKGYEYFKDVATNAKDILIAKSSKKIVEALETKYSDKI